MIKLSPKLKNLFFQTSAIIILIAAVLYSFEPTVAKYMLAIGVAGFAVITFTSPYSGKSIRGKRLFNIQILGVILMAVSAFLMFKDMGDWVVTLLIAAVITLYCSIVLPKVYKQEQEGTDVSEAYLYPVV